MAHPLLNNNVGSELFRQFEKITVLLLLIFANSIFLSAQPGDTIYRLPAGTRISVELDTEINSEISSVNDTFLAKVTRPVRIRESVVVPTGSVVEGRVVAVEHATAANRNGSLEVVFESLKLSADVRRIDAVKVSPITTNPSKLFSFLSVAVGAAAGAIIGSASKNAKGTAIGATIGAGTGTGIALLKKGKDVRIRKDEEFEIELKKEVTLPVLDY